MTEAVSLYKEQAVQLLRDPDDPVTLVNQVGLLATRSERTKAHLALTQRAAALAPNAFESVFNLGSAQMRAGHYQGALSTFRRSLSLRATPDAMQHIGMAWHDLGDFDKAVEWYDQAIRCDPDNRELRQNRAIAKLSAGQLAEGLFEFEVEYHRPARKPIAEADIPRWRGESLAGKTIIVSHEQGYGDMIQFCRFIPRVKADKVIVACPPELSGLIQANFDADDWIGEGGPFEADFYCSPMSAAAALGIEYKDIAGDPYMAAPSITLPARGHLKVGLVWRGSAGYAQDANRSMSLEDLCPLFDLPGAAFYSLQIGPASKEVSRLGLDGFIADPTVMIKDWQDTARAVMAMDVVVAVDTAVAHLAGALGKPVYLLLPFSCCWRWMRGRVDTPWYRSVKLFRQSEPNVWQGPVVGIRDELRGMN